MNTERRTLAFADLELAGMDFRGKAAVFDEPWDPALTEKFGYEEVVKPGAFRSALASTPSFPLLREHDPKMLLATTGGKTLKVEEDGASSLVVTASLPPTPLGEETRTLIDRGDLRGMSYGVSSKREGSKMFRQDGKMIRAIHAFHRMLDVSITFDPAYAGTTAELRTFAATLEDLGENPLPSAVLSGWDARIRALHIETL